MTETLKAYASKEQEYRVASWYGTLQVMASIPDRMPRNEYDKGSTSEYLYRLCQAVSKADIAFIDALYNLLLRPSDKHHIVSELGRIGIVSVDTISSDIDDAYRIFTDFDTQSLLRTDTDFFRHDAVIAESLEFLEPYIDMCMETKTTLAVLIQHIQHELDFYVGFYDTSEQVLSPIVSDTTIA